MSERKAIVLLSGGLDSATTLAMALKDGFACSALTCVYGQRHRIEVDAARRMARSLGVADHRLIPIDLACLGGSALTDPGIAVPKDRSGLDLGSAIPITYVPARNTVFLSLALAWAEVVGAWDLFIGVNCHDYSGYPDCRPQFIRAFEALANVACAAAVEGRGRFRVQAPIIGMTKAQIIRTGLDLGVDFSLTHSCYDPTAEGLSCGRCDSCVLRLRGFDQVGVPDPLRYA